MSIAYLDTHVAVWLHDGLTQKLTSTAKHEIEASDLFISPMVYIEIDYLYRRGRIGIDAPTMYANLNGTFGVIMCAFPFPAIAVVSVECQWTNDPFDRIIVAHARANRDSKLLTADETIRKNYRRAVW
ncbi:MAG: type II toxin-antitoxin system VapC family toxin [Bryobacteraceae bacterium]